MSNQRKRKKTPADANGAKKGKSAVNTVNPSSRINAILFQLVVFLVAFAIVVSRRPDALLNAQFFAEDGVVWYPDAYNSGLHSLLMPQASYLHTLTRLIALLAQLFPFSVAPLVMNLGAIAVQILPVNVFLSSRFSQIALPTRLLGSFLYVALPNSRELDATITTLQWHLALLAALLLLARPATGWVWRVFTGIVLVLISLDGPTVFVLVLLAGALWWKRRLVWDAVNLGLLVPGAAVQGLSVLLTWDSRQIAPNGASIARLMAILARQVFLPSLIGLNSTINHFALPNAATLTEMIATVLGLALLLYVVWRAPWELKFFVAFAFAVLSLCLIRPLAGPPERPQWAWLCLPGCGNRYFFLPMLSYLAALAWVVTSTSSPRILRYGAGARLLLLPIGISQDWRYPQFIDFHFQEYAAQFEQALPGTTITIPINPHWKMKLTKR